MIDVPDGETKRQLRRRVINWGRRNLADFPWRNEPNDFYSLLAEIFLQRTRAEQVVPVYQTFKVKYPNAESLANARVEDIEEVIKPLGLKWRAVFLRDLGEALVLNFGGQPPANADDLLKLPGVGHYVASSFLSLHKGIRACIVDSNIVRLYGRLFEFETGPETRRASFVNELADALTPPRAFKDYNYGLLDLTRAVCRHTPACADCPLTAFCCIYS